MNDELIDSIREALKNQTRWESKHPQYIEGTLYVTPKQYRAIVALVTDDRIPIGQLGWLPTIPVVVVGNGQEIQLPSGNILIYSEILDSFILIDPERMTHRATPSPQRGPHLKHVILDEVHQLKDMP